MKKSEKPKLFSCTLIFFSLSRLQNVARSQNPDVKVILSIGGWTDSSGDKYSRLVRDASKRRNFVAKVTKMLKTRGFDGLSLEWQYPVCWQSNCKSGNAGDKQGFSKLVKELSNAFKSGGLMLAASVSGYTDIADQAYDLGDLGKHLDMVNVMAYDYHGYWDKVTNYHSPLDKAPNSKNGKYYTVR